jgi:hypothetical protein
MLTPPRPVSENEYWVDFKKAQDLAQVLGKTLYHQGDLSYYEAVNKEMLRNAFARQEEEGIMVVSRAKDSREQPKVRLAAAWLPQRDNDGNLKAEGRLWDLCERISQGRREGKNRRDGATVKTRVLRLADLVGKELWEGGADDKTGFASGKALTGKAKL